MRSVVIYRSCTGEIYQDVMPRYYQVTMIFRLSGYDADMNEADFVTQCEDVSVIGQVPDWEF